VNRRLFVAAAAGVLCTPAVALAHAMLLRAEPAVGATLRAAPGSIQLRFSEPVEPSLCSITLTRAEAQAIPLGRLSATGGGAILVAPISGALEPGDYHVRWRAVSIDTHVTSGDFDFRLAP
jgi:copper resistance protein C